MTEDRAALVDEAMMRAYLSVCPEGVNTRALRAALAAALAMQPPVARDEMEEGVPDLREEVRVLRDCASVNLALYKGAMQDRAIAEQRADAAMGLLREVVEAHTGENIDGCGMTNQQIAAIAAFIAGGAAEVKS